MQQRTSGKIELILGNTAAVPVTLEMFNPYNTFIDYNNDNIARPAGFARIPISTAQQVIRMQAGLWAENTIGYNQSGGAQMFDATFTKVATIQYSSRGGTKSYRALMEFIKSNKIYISTVRMTVITGAPAPQFQNEFVKVTSNIFGDRHEDNRLQPIRFFNPQSIQSDIVDIKFDWEITGFTGIEVIIEPATQIQLSMEVKIL